MIAAVAGLLCGSLSAETGIPDLEEMMPLLSDLAARGSYGIVKTEQAAFIVRIDGELRCWLWHYSGEFQRQSTNLPIPEGTVAIAHTHPRCCRETSAHDQRQAERFGIAVIAVSMGTLSAVDDSGRRVESRFGISWRRHAIPGRECEAH